MNSRFKIISPVSESEFETYYRIRFEVLRKPWGQNFDSTSDETDETSYHLLVLDEFGDGVAAGRIQFNSEIEAQIRSMAVMPQVRGCGIGSLLIKELEKVAREKGMKQMVLDSREGAVEFYLLHGYEITGDSYLLFGVIPHKAMKKTL
ncbi:MAG: GNAT family N-acetyltransferase [Bacteroidota bacterium]